MHERSKTLLPLLAWSILVLLPTSVVEADTVAEAMPKKSPAGAIRVDITWTGRIGSVQDDGIIYLENGRGFKQWAVAFTDINAARKFLIGRDVFCRVVNSTLNSYDLVGFEGYAGVYDCEILSNVPEAPQTQRNSLGLYPWAADFGFARIGCEDADQMPPGVFSVQHVDGYGYRCDGEVSLRQTPVP
jgi:hypothetical protein